MQTHEQFHVDISKDYWAQAVFWANYFESLTFDSPAEAGCWKKVLDLGVVELLAKATYDNRVFDRVSYGGKKDLAEAKERMDKAIAATAAMIKTCSDSYHTVLPNVSIGVYKTDTASTDTTLSTDCP